MVILQSAGARMWSSVMIWQGSGSEIEPERGFLIETGVEVSRA